MTEKHSSSALRLFDDSVRAWFERSFDRPTAAQEAGWPAIASGDSTLIFAPTGSGKTLTAFLWCIDRLMFTPVPERKRRCRVLYVSPLKALAVDVDRNLRSPIVGIANVAEVSGRAFHLPETAIRTGDTPQRERALFLRTPSDVLITTPESLYLLLTSRSREVLRSVETVIIDEIHALVPTKRGAHLALSLERLDEIAERLPQRIGLSATQRPLDEVARFLGGAKPRRSAADTHRNGNAEAEIHAEFEGSATVEWRPVRIVDTAEKKQLALTAALDQLRAEIAASIAGALAERVKSGARRAMLIAEIDGVPAIDHPFGGALRDAGFARTSTGWQIRATNAITPRGAVADEDEEAGA
jgi:ATP-dependent Lhr-like helicase